MQTTAAQAARRTSAGSSKAGGGSSNRGEGGKCGAHTTRPPLTATPTAAPGQQTGPTAAPTSPKFVLLVFLGSVVRGIFLCETTPTRSLASHSQQEISSLRLRLPKSEWRGRRGPAMWRTPDSRDGGVENSPMAICSAC